MLNNDYNIRNQLLIIVNHTITLGIGYTHSPFFASRSLHEVGGKKMCADLAIMCDEAFLKVEFHKKGNCFYMASQ